MWILVSAQRYGMVNFEIKGEKKYGHVHEERWHTHCSERTQMEMVRSNLRDIKTKNDQNITLARND